MAQDLIILGGGVHGLEMAEMVERINAVRPLWNLRGYLVPAGRAEAAGGQRHGYPVLGTSADLERFPDAVFVPDNEFHDPVKLPAERMVSIVDPSCFVPRSARVGRGCVIYPHCFLGHNVSLGDRVFVLAGCTINHDDCLEDNVVLASGVTLAGGVRVERGCYLGQGCCVRQLLKVGAGSLIGMGAVVIGDVAPDSVMVGNPARLLRKRDAAG